MNQDLREKLADYAHTAWAGWMRYMFGKCTPTARGNMLIPYDLVERWKRQLNTPYAELPELEKESDRAEADRMLAIAGADLDQLRAALAAAEAERDEARADAAVLRETIQRYITAMTVRTPGREFAVMADAWTALEKVLEVTRSGSALLAELAGYRRYAERNPFGGPAVILDAAANRIRAGEDFYAVLKDIGLHSDDQVKPMMAELAQLRAAADRSGYRMSQSWIDDSESCLAIRAQWAEWVKQSGRIGFDLEDEPSWFGVELPSEGGSGVISQPVALLLKRLLDEVFALRARLDVAAGVVEAAVAWYDEQLRVNGSTLRNQAALSLAASQKLGEVIRAYRERDGGEEKK